MPKKRASGWTGGLPWKRRSELAGHPARHTGLACLASVFPRAYTLPVSAQAEVGGMSKMRLDVQIRRASLDDLDQLSRLFDLYRQFYKYSLDLSND